MNHQHDLINRILLSFEAIFIWLHFDMVDKLAKFGCTCLIIISTTMIIIINWEKFINSKTIKNLTSKWKK